MKKLNSSRKLRLETLEDRTLLAVTAGGMETAASLAAPTESQTWVVNTTADPADWGETDSEISLREAIGRAAAGDTITFDSTLAGQTITLCYGELYIDTTLTIDASSIDGITIDAGGESRVLCIDQESDDQSVALVGLTITGGNAENGGGIFTFGVLALTDCTVSGNAVSGEYGDYGVYSGMGGGICNFGALTMTNCIVSGNATDSSGGGIYNGEDGTLALTDCVIAGNFANRAESGDGWEMSEGGCGGGICNYGELTLTGGSVTGNTSSYGGGIFSGYSSVTLADCAITGNSADGYSYSYDGEGSSYSAYGYGGGVYSQGGMTITNCTISENSVAGIYREAEYCGAWGYGGGVHSDGVLTMDGCTVTGNTGAGMGGGIYNSGASALTNCVVSGNSAIGTCDEEFDFDPSGCGGGIENYGTLILTDCTVTGNTAGNSGGGIDSGGELTLTGCTVAGNSVESSVIGTGGGICNFGASTLTDCTVSENTVSGESGTGGGIDNSGYLTLTNCTVVGNTADGLGGGICSWGEQTIVSGTISGNSAMYVGGGIYSSGEQTIILDCVISGNSAMYMGGGICCHDHEMTLSDCLISENICVGDETDGGGIYADCGSLTLVGCVISGNEADNGGGLENDDLTKTELINCLITGNTGRNRGGGLYNAHNDSNGAELSLINCTVAGNSAGSVGGGGICNLETVYLYNTVVVQNEASGSGKDIYKRAGSVYGYNVLSSYSGWTDSSGCLAYIASRPLFVNAAAGDYKLVQNSQAINKGNNSYISGYETDLAGNPRIVNNIVDLGAYEYDPNGGPSGQLAAPEITVGKKGIHVSYGADRHQIAWTVVENALGYELSYSADGSRWTTVSISDTSAVVTGLTYGADMRYRVRALGTGSYTDSDWSEVKTFNVCPMDINGDSDISNGDRALLASSWLFSEGDDEFIYACDINGDGDISNGDRSFLSINWLGSAGDDDLQYPRALRADAVFAEFASADLEVDWGIF